MKKYAHSIRSGPFVLSRCTFQYEWAVAQVLGASAVPSRLGYSEPQTPGRFRALMSLAFLRRVCAHMLPTSMI
ncbi:MAG: hypothetical protein ACXV7G_11505 [Halobacteriota archaeon]